MSAGAGFHDDRCVRLMDWLIIESNWMKCSANFNLFYRKRRRYSLWHLRFALIMTALVSTTYWLTILTARTCLGKYPFKSFTWFVNKLWLQQQVTGCQSLSYLPLDLSSSTKLDTRECISKLVVYPVYQSPVPPSPLSPIPSASRHSPLYAVYVVLSLLLLTLQAGREAQIFR